MFRGRLYGHKLWVVVDPAYPDPLFVKDEWERFGDAVKPIRSRLSSAAGWIAALAIVALGVWVGSHLSERHSWILGAVALFASALTGAIAGFALASFLAPDAHPHHLSENTRRLHRSVIAWADDTAPLLKTEHLRAFADLEALAARTGFPIPEELRTLDTPTAD